jgi:hypothetical protein
MTGHINLLETSRTFGQKRLEIVQKAKSQADWIALWNDPAHPYPFEWGTCWKACVEYKVEDFEAELGFWLDIVGLDSNVLAPDFAMINTPDNHFVFAVSPSDAAQATPPNAVKLQFMLKEVCKSAAELEERGIVFHQPIQPTSPGSSLYTGAFRTPAGIAVELWGVEERQAPE